MKYMLSLLSLVLTATTAFGQQASHTEIWRAQPVLAQMTDRFEEEAAVFIADNRIIEFRDNADKEVEQVKTIHRIIRVNNDQGIERFNKVYLPGGKSNKTLRFMARSVLPGGKVIEVDSSSLKDYTDEDGDEYKIFAVPGLVKGAEIEYSYTWLRSEASLFGTEVVQQGVPVLSSRVIIQSPARLIFEGRSFNGKSATQDTIADGKRIVSFTFGEMAAAEEEKYANLGAQVLRLEYKLSYNKESNNGARLFTWNEFARRVYSNYSSYSDKEKKRAADLVDQLKLKKMSTTAEKVAALEQYVKANIMVRKDLSDESRSMVDMILKNKMASELGIIRLYGAALEQAGIEHQFVLAGDRSRYELDKTFENWNNADNPLILVVETGKYFAPTRPEFRYPWIVPDWCLTMGLHMKTTSLGAVKTAMADMRMIPMAGYQESYSNLEARIVIVPEKDSLLAEMKHIFGGYSAIPYRAAFNFGGAESYKEIMKEMAKYGTNSEKVITSKVVNQDFQSQNESKPLILELSVRADQLMEKAGQKILLKVGEIIGPQIELYQEKQRVFPIDISYPHQLLRTITVEIPKGYRVKNPEALSISQAFPSADAPDMQFTCTYKQEGEKLVIKVTEEYRSTRYALTDFEVFRKVINASADFNKIVLVLEPLK